ncbi:MAG: LacI family DNA-binding transcriptional regulator [Oscillospiraceae bacterium]
MGISLKDIARELGISVSTVSRVANNKDRVSEETRQLVREALEKYDYMPNETARIMRGKASSTIGIVVSDISNIFFARLIKGAEDAAMAEGYNILVCNTDSDSERERKSVELLLSKHVSGIIMASASYSTTFADQIDEGTPYVYIDNLPTHTGQFNSVAIDNRLAARELLHHLLSLGHRNIAMLAGSQEETSGRERLAGWREVIAQEKLAIPEDWIVTGEFTIPSGYQATERFLAQRTRPTAILAANNSLAYGAMLALRRHGHRVPEDVSIAAFDADDETGLITPQITTVNQPVQDFGRVAVELCLDAKKGKEQGQYHQVALPHQFVAGGSVCAAAGGEAAPQ